MGYNIFNGDISDIALFHSKRTIINTINPHSYVVAGGDSLFRKSLISSDILIPDGGGILLAARLILNKKIKKITGPDIHKALLINLNMKNGKCFYMGASQRTLNLIKKRISKEFPNILVEIYSPPFSDTFSEAENLDIVNNINNFSPDVLFIGMTAPKQEKWLYENKDKLDFKVATCIGGAFDFANGILIILCKILKIPIICLGNAEEFTLTLHGKGLKNWVKRFWLKFTHKKADGFIVVCHFCRDVLTSIGVNPNKIFVVPSSINPNKISKETIDRSGGYNIISVGRIVERKGFHKLILATKELINDFPKIHTNIVGDGPYLEELIKLIRDNKLERYITLHGRLSDEKLAKLYKNSQLFVLAHMMLENGDTEGCPTVFSEASGQGLPVIGGTDAGASTVIIEGISGFIVNSRNISELSDRIKKILGDSQLAKNMGENGIKKIMKEHTPSVTG